jgi:hypothetical protein
MMKNVVTIIMTLAFLLTLVSMHGESKNTKSLRYHVSGGYNLSLGHIKTPDWTKEYNSCISSGHQVNFSLIFDKCDVPFSFEPGIMIVVRNASFDWIEDNKNAAYIPAIGDEFVNSTSLDLYGKGKYSLLGDKNSFRWDGFVGMALSYNAHSKLKYSKYHAGGHGLTEIAPPSICKNTDKWNDRFLVYFTAGTDLIAFDKISLRVEYNLCLWNMSKDPFFRKIIFSTALISFGIVL